MCVDVCVCIWVYEFDKGSGSPGWEAVDGDEQPWVWVWVWGSKWHPTINGQAARSGEPAASELRATGCAGARLAQ